MSNALVQILRNRGLNAQDGDDMKVLGNLIMEQVCFNF